MAAWETSSSLGLSQDEGSVETPPLLTFRIGSKEPSSGQMVGWVERSTEAIRLRMRDERRRT